MTGMERSADGAATRRASAWSAAAERALDEAGHRSGGARSAVIELLAAEDGCLEAEQVAAELRSRGRRVGTASVYRALALLGELGLVRKVTLPDAPSRFELVQPDGEHHHHLICGNCGATSAFSDEALEEAIRRVSRSSDFAVETHEITLQGLCPACRVD